jgi:small conductance mechanosensitive channel
MQNDISRLRILGETLTQHGTSLVLALVILISGLLVARWLHNTLERRMRRLHPESKAAPLMCNLIYIAVIALTIMGTAVEMGAPPENLVRLTAIIMLIVVGVMIFLRPLIPALPFRVGNTVKAGKLLGKVEAISFLNTRLKTFDGKTFFVPNRKIVDDIVINYHFSQTRRVKIDLSIRYDQDLLKAKRTLEMIMVQDPRVKRTSAPVVYVMDLGANGVELGGRCWVDNKDYWVARCDLREKTKLIFDTEGLQFAFPQLDLHIEPNALQLVESGKSSGSAPRPKNTDQLPGHSWDI